MARGLVDGGPWCALRSDASVHRTVAGWWVPCLTEDSERRASGAYPVITGFLMVWRVLLDYLLLTLRLLPRGCSA